MGFQRYNGQESNRNKDKAVPKTIHNTKTITARPGIIARGSRVPVVEKAK